MKPRVRPARLALTHVVSLGSRLTDRDRQIALDCYEHHVLTTSQLQRLHFTGLRTAEARLDALHRLRVLDRFRPPARHGAGTAPYHWILDEAGAHVVAAQYGLERRELKWRHATALAVADSPKLRHHIEINEFFAQLAQEAATNGGALAEWYGERTIHGLFDRIVWPDGYGVLALPDRAAIHFLLELDRSTEPAAQLRDKALRYATAIPRSTLAPHHPLVILAVPTHARARAASKATADTGAPVTVAVWSKPAARSALAIVSDAREYRMSDSLQDHGNGVSDDCSVPAIMVPALPRRPSPVR
jgi:Replication-relaxation